MLKDNTYYEDIINLRKEINQEVFDYQTLMAVLGDRFVDPRGYIKRLMRKGDIVRIKKGLYIFGEVWRRGPVNRELLANLIYGPSYLSLDYALAWHGMIPERVEVLTSVTTGRSRVFDTPVGRFEYRQVPMAGFSSGMLRVDAENGGWLIACRERALADKIRDDRGCAINSCRDAGLYLLENLRIGEQMLGALNIELLEELCGVLRSRKLKFCIGYIRKMSIRGIP